MKWQTLQQHWCNIAKALVTLTDMLALAQCWLFLSKWFFVIDWCASGKWILLLETRWKSLTVSGKKVWVAKLVCESASKVDTSKLLLLCYIRLISTSSVGSLFWTKWCGLENYCKSSKLECTLPQYQGYHRVKIWLINSKNIWPHQNKSRLKGMGCL